MLTMQFGIDVLFIWWTYIHVYQLASKCNKKDLFYCKPVGKFNSECNKSWYIAQYVDHNPLKKKLKEICEAAGIDCSEISIITVKELLE